MIAVVGRRRVGKTFLVRAVYSKIDLELVGVPKAALAEQLQNFSIQLRSLLPEVDHYPRPSSWLEAFNLLKGALESKSKPENRFCFSMNCHGWHHRDLVFLKHWVISGIAGRPKACDCGDQRISSFMDDSQSDPS